MGKLRHSACGVAIGQGEEALWGSQEDPGVQGSSVRVQGSTSVWMGFEMSTDLAACGHGCGVGTYL